MRQIQAAVRAYTPGPSRTPGRRTRWHRPKHILVFDTETWTDAAQALRFGFFRYVRVDWSERGAPALEVLEESIVVADDPNPHDLEVLKAYRRRKPDVDRVSLDAQYAIHLYPRRDFVEDVLYPAMTSNTTWVVGANLPFDLSRLVAPHLEISGTGWEAGPGYQIGPDGKRTRRDEPGFYTHGFSLPLAEYEAEDGWRERKTNDNPRLGLKRLGPQRTAMGLIDSRFHGHFLDVLTLGAALSGQHLPLTAARPKKGFCEVFGVDYGAWLLRFGVSFGKGDAPHGADLTPEYVAYNRADVAATTELFVALMEEHRALGIQTQPTKIFSSASVSKDTLRRLRVPPRLDAQPDFPEDVMGFAMTSFYGGRSEVRIRRTPVPVTYVDVKSMYPAVSALLNLQGLIAADRVVVRDSDTDRALLEPTQRFLDGLSLDESLDPGSWSKLRGIALVEPDGDLLPVRADWGPEALGIAQCYVSSASEPSWWALPDLAAARLRAPGRSIGPKLRRVIYFDGEGEAGLKGINIAERRLDLRRHDLYASLIETRESKGRDDNRWDRFLKVVANSLYGITAEMNATRTVDGKRRPVDVHALRSFTAPTALPETPGAFFFAPVATLTTAGARLILALMERLVTDLGGSWCFADTDSMAIVSTSTGGLIPCRGGQYRSDDADDAVRALSWDEIDHIRGRINSLNPYDQSVIPDLLKIEDVNYSGRDPFQARRELWAWAVSAKRYMLFQREDAASVVATGEDHASEALDEDEIEEHRLHGLGHLMDPGEDGSHNRQWTKQAWAWMFDSDRELIPPKPDWFARPALSRHTVSSPMLLRAFSGYNAGREYEDAIKPFNFMLVAHPTAEESRRHSGAFRVGAPYSDDPSDWVGGVWLNVRGSTRDNPGPYSIVTEEPDLDLADVVQVQSYGRVIRDYLAHPEAKADTSNGNPCEASSRGLLTPPRVHVSSWLAIGKETNRLSDREGGLAGAWETTNAFEERDAEEVLWESLLRVMNLLGIQRIWREIVVLQERNANQPGLDIANSTVRDIVKGRSRGSVAHRSVLTSACERGMKRWLRQADQPPTRSSLAAVTHQFVDAWMSLVTEPAARYEEAVTRLASLPWGSKTRIAGVLGVSRQRLADLRDPELRAAMVGCVQQIERDHSSS